MASRSEFWKIGEPSLKFIFNYFHFIAVKTIHIYNPN